MAPFRRDGGLPGGGAAIWAIVVVCVGAVGVTGLVIYYLVDRVRNRDYRRACQTDPYLTRSEFGRRRKMTSMQRIEEEELQRDMIIRKTLDARWSQDSPESAPPPGAHAESNTPEDRRGEAANGGERSPFLPQQGQRTEDMHLEEVNGRARSISMARTPFLAPNNPDTPLHIPWGANPPEYGPARSRTPSPPHQLNAALAPAVTVEPGHTFPRDVKVLVDASDSPPQHPAFREEPIPEPQVLYPLSRSQNRDSSRSPRPSPLPLEDELIRNDVLLKSPPPPLTPPAAAVSRDPTHLSVVSHPRNRSVSDLAVLPTAASRAHHMPDETLPCPPRKPFSPRSSVRLPQQSRSKAEPALSPPTYEEVLGRSTPFSTGSTPQSTTPRTQRGRTPTPRDTFAQDSELKELGFPMSTTPRNRHRTLSENRATPNRQDGRLANGALLSPHAVRDRARSIEGRSGIPHLAGGQWHLQVSVLDQTGVGGGQRSSSPPAAQGVERGVGNGQDGPEDPTIPQSSQQRLPPLSTSTEATRAPHNSEAGAQVTPVSGRPRMQARLNGPPELMPYFN